MRQHPQVPAWLIRDGESVLIWFSPDAVPSEPITTFEELLAFISMGAVRFPPPAPSKKLDLTDIDFDFKL